MLLLPSLLLPACVPGKILLGDDTAAASDDRADDTGADTDDTEDPSDTDDPGDSGDDTDDPGDTGPDTEDPGDTGTDTEDPGDTGEPAPDCVPYGLAASDSIELAYGAGVDAYDSTRGVWSSANSSSDAAISVNARSACALQVDGTVSGTAYTGGDPSTVGCLGWGASVSGGFVALPSAVTMPTVSVPAGLPSSSGDQSTQWGETWTIAGDTVLDDVVLAYGSTVEVTRSATVHVRGDLRSDGATFNVASGATLDLYVSGDLQLAWGSAFNASGAPSSLRIHIVGSGNLSIANGAALTALVQQPDGELSNAGTFSGTWIGQSARADWGATHHLDVSEGCP
jgi:hypothetical protein